MEINPFGKAPRQASNIVGGGKELTKTTASKKTGNPTEIISTVVNIQNIYICIFQRDTNSAFTRNITICSQAGEKIFLVAD